MSRSTRLSLQRLRAMPAVMTLPMLVRETGWSRAMASVYVARWVATGLISQIPQRIHVAVPPLFALRDMYASPECWHPDPDDLGLPDDVQDLFDLR